MEPALSVMDRMDTRARTYIASKSFHGHRWKELRAQGCRIVSTWIDECGAGETDDFSDLFDRCIREASQADVLILYREDGEILKGALIEAGAARNVIVGPGYSLFNFGLAKSIAMERAGTLQIALTFQNAMNHVNLGQPNITVSAAQGGTITSPHIFPSAGSPRTGQLSLRWSF